MNRLQHACFGSFHALGAPRARLLQLLQSGAMQQVSAPNVSAHGLRYRTVALCQNCSPLCMARTKPRTQWAACGTGRRPGCHPMLPSCRGQSALQTPAKSRAIRLRLVLCLCDKCLQRIKHIPTRSPASVAFLNPFWKSFTCSSSLALPAGHGDAFSSSWIAIRALQQPQQRHQQPCSPLAPCRAPPTLALGPLAAGTIHRAALLL